MTIMLTRSRKQVGREGGGGRGKGGKMGRETRMTRCGYEPDSATTGDECVNQRNQCVFRNTETPISDASSFRDNIRGRLAD